MTGSPFRSARSCSGDERNRRVQHRAAHTHRGDVAALLASTAATASRVIRLLHRASMPRIVYASRSVILGNSGCARLGEKREKGIRERCESRVARAHASFYVSPSARFRRVSRENPSALAVS